MAEIKQAVETIEIDAGVDDIFPVVADLHSYPEWADNIDAIEVLESDEDGYPLKSQMTLDVVIKKVTFQLSYVWDYPAQVHWSGLPGGDINHIDGTYAFEDLGSGRTKVTYTLEIDPGFRVPSFMMDKARTSIAKSALKGLKARVESLA